MTIGPDGVSTIEVDGVKGSSCSRYVDALVRGLSAEIVSDSKKPEYFEHGEEDKENAHGY